MENNNDFMNNIMAQKTDKMSKAPILILNGSRQPYLSIGRHFGGVKAWGHEYLYMPLQDAFLRKDYVKEYNKISINDIVDIKCAMELKTLIDAIVKMANASDVLKRELIENLK